ncbi:hypothetical protein ACQVP2_28255 [Methylobacterium aquaticum]|uniref:hypothetical protein n=1 Tax=Methylobacterium aquaticum TaxID=270351 RepID=UPI003D180677
MSPPVPPDLFSAAGLVLEVTPPRKPKRKAKRQRKPNPAERAAAARALGARRASCPCADGVRVRIGEPRDLHRPREVLAYPLSRNVALLNEVMARLPHGYDDKFENKWVLEGRRQEKRLRRMGLNEEMAYNSAVELMDTIWTIRMRAANAEYKEANAQ